MTILSKLILNQSEILNLFCDKLIKNDPLLITYFNAHCFNLYNELNDYKKLLDKDFFVYTDGIGICLLMKKLGKSYKVFNATDLNQKLIEIIISKKLSIILISSDYDDKAIYKIASGEQLLIEKYINGFQSDDEIITELQATRSDIILIGMGVPRQEFVAKKVMKIYPQKKIICVGNFFNFYFGFQKRAPIIYRSLGLEWLFRLLTEPKRLWKRYLIGIPLFIIRVLILKIKLMIKKT